MNKRFKSEGIRIDSDENLSEVHVLKDLMLKTRRESSHWKLYNAIEIRYQTSTGFKAEQFINQAEGRIVKEVYIYVLSTIPQSTYNNAFNSFIAVQAKHACNKELRIDNTNCFERDR